MKAVLIESHGPIANLHYREWPDPALRPDDVLVEVKAVGLNHFDLFVRKGMPGVRLPMPFISGGDIAGVVGKCGANVSEWRVGDRVAVNPITADGMLGEQIHGGMAELVRVPACNLIPVPALMDFVTAAAIPVNFGTALRMLETVGQVQAGETMLVLGASGGVGTACVQLGKHIGATVIAVTRGAAKVQALAALGADHVIDSDSEDFSAAAWKLSGKKGVDVVINFTGGDTWVPSLRALRHRGRLITCGATAGFDPKTDIRYIWVRELRIFGSDGYTQQDIERAFDIIQDGSVQPLLSKVLDIREVREAHRLLESREVIGKLVLTVPERAKHAAGDVNG